MTEPNRPAGWLAWVREQWHPLYWLLLAVPTALVLELVHAPALAVFAAASLAVVPLAALMGRATENLAESLGPAVGGLLNSTFGNAAELIIALFAVAQGPNLYPMVQASLTGSIIGNVLLVLGLAILGGGLLHKKQTFNRTSAGMGTTLLALAAIGLLTPTLFNHVARASMGPEQVERGLVYLSEEIAAVLAVVYLLSLLFTLKTHSHLFAGAPTEKVAHEVVEAHGPHWSRRVALTVLLTATAGVAVMAHVLVNSVEQAAGTLGLNQLFVGVFVVAIIGNAAENSSAVLVALKNKMDLSVTIAVGSGLQIALFVAPMLVFASLLFNPGQPLTLHFHPMEVLTVVAAIGVLALVANDGETHWMEGVMLLALYAIFGLAFYNLPNVPAA